MMVPLFAYGSLCDPVWRCEILGAEYPWEPATVVGWQRVTLLSYGYLSIRESAYNVVDGVLVELDEIGWRIADAWEEVPKYVRVPVEARTTTGLVAARTYVIRGRSDEAQRFEDDTLLAAIPRHEVDASIAVFRRIRDEIRSGAR